MCATIVEFKCFSSTKVVRLAGRGYVSREMVVGLFRVSLEFSNYLLEDPILTTMSAPKS